MASGSCILTWRGSISDQWGVSPKTRPFHCTLTWLTLAITANVGNSTVQFLVVGVCVRAHPLPNTMKYFKKCMYTCTHMYMHRTYMCLHVRMLVCICIYVYMHACVHTRMYVCMHMKVCIHAYEKIMHAHMLWMYAGACMHAYDSMYMNGKAWIREFIFVLNGPHSAVVQRRGNPWSGWSKPRSLDRELKIRLIYESLNERRTRY